MMSEPVMKRRPILRPALAMLAVSTLASLPAYAAEHITLRNGAELDCVRREPLGDRVRLYLITSTPAASADANYVEVSASAVLRVESIPDPPPPPAAASAPAAEVGAPHLAPEIWVGNPGRPASSSSAPFTPAQMTQMLARAGAAHNIDADLLASVVQAESAGNPFAVSRAGAQGLMQLMPSTASQLNVHNSFQPEENIGGGTAYLDQLLTRYDPNNDARGLALAVAAYNAGPAAVDRYHGIPPYPETRAYVARIIREFNRRKRAASTSHPALAAANAK
jgi:soluble lytic murein transglycosylase-like protein